MNKKADLEHEIRQRDLIYKTLNRAEYNEMSHEDRACEIIEAIRELMFLLENKGIITTKLTADEED